MLSVIRHARSRSYSQVPVPFLVPVPGPHRDRGRAGEGGKWIPNRSFDFVFAPPSPSATRAMGV